MQNICIRTGAEHRIMYIVIPRLQKSYNQVVKFLSKSIFIELARDSLVASCDIHSRISGKVAKVDFEFYRYVTTEVKF